MEKQVVWRKSSYSTLEGNCVEVADLPHGGRAVRDSKNPTGPAPRFSPTQWSAFTRALNRAEIG